MAAMAPQLAPRPLREGELELLLRDVLDPATSRWGVQAYLFEIALRGARVGSLSLRIGATPNILLYAGHIGFSGEEAHRGQRLAERATRLVLPFARAAGLDALWLTCDPRNLASRRTIERLGAQFVEEIAIPPDYESHARGERAKRRYRLDLAGSARVGAGPA
jgi:tagatose 1,6-diphosphate aldolase